MFLSTCTATVEDMFKCNMDKYLYPAYTNVRTIDIDEINIYNATFLEDGKYYNTVNINNISEKEAIMKFAEKEKVFGEEENKILENIIERNLVQTKNNFFDYYD